MENTFSQINRYGIAIVSEHADYRPTTNGKGQLMFKKKGKGRWQETVPARLYDHSDIESGLIYRSKDNTFEYKAMNGQTEHRVTLNMPNQRVEITGDNLSDNTARIAFKFRAGISDVTIEFNIFEDTSLYSSICVKIDNFTIWSLILYDECALYTFDKNAYYRMLASEFNADNFMALITNVLMYYKNYKGYGIWDIDTLNTVETIKPGLMECIKDFINNWKKRMIELSMDSNLEEPRLKTVQNAMDAIQFLESNERRSGRGNK